MSATPDERRIAIVGSELEAEMLCSLLQEHGVRATHRRTAAAGVDWGVVNVGMSGAREVLVLEADEAAAREVLESCALAADGTASTAEDDATDARQRAAAQRLRIAFGVFALIVFASPLLYFVLAPILSLPGGVG